MITRKVIKTVIRETEGLTWGQNKIIASGTVLGTNVLQDKLFNILKNKTIIEYIRLPGEGSSICRALTIRAKSDIKLRNHMNEDLIYYDPGLVPKSFNIKPNDNFDTRK